MRHAHEPTDAEILMILELRDRGWAFSKIALTMRMQRNSVLGMHYRVTKAAGPPDEFDGTMPYGWWKEGLRKRNG